MPKIQEDQIEFSSSGGPLESAHRAYDQLVHNIAENSFVEILPAASAQPTSITIWDSNLKSKKIREILLTYTNGLVSQAVTKQYDSIGSVIIGETLTQTPTYSGGLVLTVDQVES